VASSLTSAATEVGFARSIDTSGWSEEALVRLFLISNTAGFFSVLAALWSKTSFALTLLRISDGWVARLIWTIIVLMNLVMGISCVLLFFEIDMAAKVGYYIFSTCKLRHERPLLY